MGRSGKAKGELSRRGLRFVDSLLISLYILGSVIGLVFLVLLFWAPIKLYAIHRELVRLNKQTHAQLQLLAVIANALSPADGRSTEEKVRDLVAEERRLKQSAGAS